MGWAGSADTILADLNKFFVALFIIAVSLELAAHTIRWWWQNVVTNFIISLLVQRSPGRPE
jgi:hypothetical protein